jgi:phosphatidylethanolamine/phosphatidyl-N-methylethanolamine N-methyltransferase
LIRGPNHSGHRRAGSDFAVFFLESVHSLTVTASLFPSSRVLVSALLQPVDFHLADIIIELGSGTGVVTSEILRRMKPRATLYAIDINPIFVSHVRDRLRDSRLILIQGDAKHLGRMLRGAGVARVETVVSSLSLTWMNHKDRSSIMKQVALHLSNQGVLTQYQYLHACRTPKWASALGIPRFRGDEFLRHYFSQVCSESVFWNLPPAAVYTCRP